MTKLRLGGVPEYFNLPIIQALESGAFREAGIDLSWQEIPEGTGKMMQSLSEDSLDLVVSLMEGTTKSIAQGNPSRIIHTYVQSPLVWGIHTGAHQSARTVEELQGQPIAISRYGSGSHLMAILMARDLGWDTEALKFEVINNLDGAREALKNDTAQVFLWEKYTTKFLVDKGEFRRVGEYPTPWPCFVIAATNKILEQEPQAVKRLLEVITHSVQQFVASNETAAQIVDRYQLLPEDVADFLPVTQWNAAITLPEQEVAKVLRTFRELGQLEAAEVEITQALV